MSKKKTPAKAKKPGAAARSELQLNMRLLPGEKREWTAAASRLRVDLTTLVRFAVREAIRRGKLTIG